MKQDKTAIEPESAGELYDISMVAEQINVLEERRSQIEQRLNASELRYRRLFETAQDGILIIDAGTEEITDVNPFLSNMLGYTKEHFIGKRLWEIGFFKDITANKEAFEELQTKGFIRYEDLPLETKRGRSMDVEFVSNVYMVEGVKVIQCNIRDITARKKAEEALNKAKINLELKVKQRTAKLSRANKQLAYYSSQVIRAQEDERKNIAFELHDQIGQYLTSLKMIMNHAEFAPSSEFGSILKEAQGVVSEVMQKVSEMSLNLRPHMLDVLGLLPALFWHIEKYTVQTRMKVNFEHSGVNRAFSPDVNIVVFRIIQESLTNIARHANVNEAFIHLWADEKAIHLVVKDLGSGFNPASRAMIASSGLSGMRERARLLGGSVKIASAPGSGTCLTAEIPISNFKAKLRPVPETIVQTRQELSAVAAG